MGPVAIHIEADLSLITLYTWRAATVTMASMSEEEKAAIRETFNAFDSNGDGTICTSELGTFLRSMGQNPTDAEVQEAMNALDANGNGKIEFNEWLQQMGDSLLSEDDLKEQLRDAFMKFDKDGNGTLNSSELKHALTTLGENLSDEEVEAVFKEIDRDSDGKLNYEELIKYIQS